MMREILELLKRRERLGSAAEAVDSSSEHEDDDVDNEMGALDMFIANLPLLNDSIVRDFAPPRFRTLNKEPKRHHNRSRVGNFHDERANEDYAAEENDNTNNKLELAVAGGQHNGQNWEQVVKDKAKMMEMHAF